MHLVDEYIEHRVQRGELVASSIEVIKRQLRQWHRHAGPVDLWTPEMAVEWVHGQQWNLRPNARRGRRSALVPYCRWLHHHGHTAVDCGYDIPRVRVPRRPPRNLPGDQVRTLLAACPDLRAVTIVTLMVQCGLRCSSVAWALIEDIDPARRMLAVREKGGRGEVTNEVAIPDEAWQVLVAYLGVEGRSSGPLIRNLRRTAATAISPNRMSVLVNGWVRAAGLKAFPYDGVSAHALRHTCAQDMFDRGATVEEVQHTLGHRRRATTEDYYVNSRPATLAVAMGGRTYLPSLSVLEGGGEQLSAPVEQQRAA